MLRTAIRKATPPWARRLVVSLAREVPAPGVPSWTPPPRLPEELISACRMCASRDHMLKELPKGGRVAEVGTAEGVFAAIILAVCEPAELHLIDIDFSRLRSTVADDCRVTRHVGRSHERLAEFPNGSFDWVYVDADHSYSAVSQDIAVAAAKVRPGGFLVFNDFAHADPLLNQYGVHRAVVEFAVQRRWPFVLFAYAPSGLYDVALQRPSSDAQSAGAAQRML